MLRRKFFKTLGSNLALLLVPKWARTQAAASAKSGAATLNDVAAVVLPASLGAKRISEISGQFEKWIADYVAGADAGSGYGVTHPRVLGPNPSAKYGGQLKQLDLAAGAKGSGFAGLNDVDKRAIVQSALGTAGVNGIPARPNGGHVATDIMSFFYASSDGQDFCYNAAIRQADCRGLASSGKRPATLS